MNLPSSERVCVFRRKRDNLSVTSTGTWRRGTHAIAAPAGLVLISTADHQRLQYFKAKHYKANLSNIDQDHSHCQRLPVLLVLMLTLIKGQVLPAHGRGTQVAAELSDAHERTAQPCRTWLLGSSSAISPATGGWMKCGLRWLLGRRRGVDPSF